VYECATGTAVTVDEGVNGLKLCVSYGCLYKRRELVLVTEGAKIIK
jgi:hypothetical protein